MLYLYIAENKNWTPQWCSGNIIPSQGIALGSIPSCGISFLPHCSGFSYSMPLSLLVHALMFDVSCVFNCFVYVEIQCVQGGSRVQHPLEQYPPFPRLQPQQLAAPWPLPARASPTILITPSPRTNPLAATITIRGVSPLRLVRKAMIPPMSLAKEKLGTFRNPIAESKYAGFSFQASVMSGKQAHPIYRTLFQKVDRRRISVSHVGSPAVERISCSRSPQRRIQTPS